MQLNAEKKKDGWHYSVVGETTKEITLQVVKSSRFFSNSEPNGSELLENHQEILPHHYLHSDVFGGSKSSTTPLCVICLKMVKDSQTINVKIESVPIV